MQYIRNIFLRFHKFFLTNLLRMSIMSCNKYVINIFLEEIFLMGMRKVLTRVFLAVAGTSILSTATAFAAASGSINDDGVNIRSGASTSSDVIGTAGKGTELVLHGRDGDWYQVTFNGSNEAYVSADYLDVTRAEGTVEGSDVNVRTGSNTKSDIIKTVNDGDVITVIGKLDGWYQLAYNNGNAYISQDYLEGDMLTYLPVVSATEEVVEEQQPNEEKTQTTTKKETYGVVIADSSLRVRSSASTNGEILENLDGGEIFDVLEAGTDWLKIQTAKGTTGYVSTEYVSLRKGEKPASNRIAPAPSGEGLQVIEYAQRFLGTPYVWAGTDLENGVDCSGYVYAVMQHFGVSLNRSSAAMTANGVEIDKEELAAGDLVFFDSDKNGSISHVGIYMGDNKYIHASSGKAASVIVSDLTDSYSAGTYVTARRVLV